MFVLKRSVRIIPKVRHMYTLYFPWEMLSPPSPAPFLPFYTKEVKIIVLARFHMNLKGIWQNLLRIATADSLLFKLNRGLSHPVGPAMLYFRVSHIVLDIKSISILLAVQQSIGIHV